MDRNSIIGFVLIGVILIIWLLFLNKSNKQLDDTKKIETHKVQDSLSKTPAKDSIKVTKLPDTTSVKKDSVLSVGFLSKFEKGQEKILVIETDKYYAEFSTKGGSLIKYEVKNFKTWDGYPVQLLKLDKGGELNLLFTSIEGKAVNTKDLYFNSNYYAWQNVNIKGQNEFEIKFELPINDSNKAKIIKSYKIKNGSYDFDLNIEFQNSKFYLSNYEYQLIWENSLKLTEYRSDAEANFAEAFSFMGDELEIVDATKKDENYKSDLSGNTNWVSSRIKYFCVALMSGEPKPSGSYITGHFTPLPDNGHEEFYSVALKMLIKNDKSEKANFKIYLGPVDYEILKSYDKGLEKTMRFSLDFLVRPIAQYAIIPVFLFLHKFISNWGIVIIIFSIILKILLSPITKYQMRSMKKMTDMQPKMNAIKEKHKDDPQKQQQAIMKFYREEKINPMGGCLPMLLQLPILYALFGVFNSTIELRQAYFGLWIKDLSIPDVIMHLPFKIPLFGLDYLSGLALLMGITMFIQQKMTVKDPKQKAMIYMMPIMLTMLFTTLPAGLNLYYFMFNVLSIGEQIYTTKFSKKKAEENALINKK